MTTSTALEYGTCPCQGRYEYRQVEVSVTIGDQTVVLTNVPQGACPKCGSRVYKTEVLERIEAVMKGEKIDRSINQSLA